jgi:hypothetical protein
MLGVVSGEGIAKRRKYWACEDFLGLNVKFSVVLVLALDYVGLDCLPSLILSKCLRAYARE